ncbi:endonuclease/exonuclease/phosphatase family protein [Pelagicoccus sp. SDUM812002]|uniref:endonuclease/exonuclease/phosphatase family protein n=1 Tax=Pelagicoccus sp. SDUM812002 TaxID=3041266 RepID=UPI00280CA64A|nr:endonuclease/exonuclease/phosphatase family protein [Pelagicoccus sp. SDUM812002]MDQ8183972.1 endonuclease/exonuclease/phosphatase family protein [Pelagicoccus sp. SDUM812002]
MFKRLCFSLCLLLSAVAAQGQTEAESIRLGTYNLRNYLAMDRLVEGQFRLDYPKPETEKTVVRQAIVAAAPDVLAVQEIGTEAELLELLDDLRQDGLSYSSHYILEADDDTRRVGALWNEEVQVRPVPHIDLGFNLFDEPMKVKRGMLELEVQTGGGLGFSIFILHLKSKYTSDKRDPQSTRRRTKEAHSARERILEIFPDPLNSSFLVVGDLNDHRNSSPVRRFLNRGELEISQILEAKDSSGLIWTHYYKKGGEYSLLDYMLASSGLVKTFDTSSGIVDRRDYYEGSDHRLVWTDLQLK